MKLRVAACVMMCSCSSGEPSGRRFLQAFDKWALFGLEHIQFERYYITDRQRDANCCHSVGAHIHTNTQLWVWCFPSFRRSWQSGGLDWGTIVLTYFPSKNQWEHSKHNIPFYTGNDEFKIYSLYKKGPQSWHLTTVCYTLDWKRYLSVRGKLFLETFYVTRLNAVLFIVNTLSLN